MKEILAKKSAIIYENELLVGNFTSKRIGANLYNEWLSGIGLFFEGLIINRRKYNPFKISLIDKLRLIKMAPFWLRNNTLFKFFDKGKDRLDVLL